VTPLDNPSGKPRDVLLKSEYISGVLYGFSDLSQGAWHLKRSERLRTLRERLHRQDRREPGCANSLYPEEVMMRCAKRRRVFAVQMSELILPCAKELPLND